MWDEHAAFQAYAAYGADLIRSAGILVGATPSVIFRATVLFQRFEHVVNRDFRAHYYTREEMTRLRAAQDRLVTQQADKSDSSFYPSSRGSSIASGEEPKAADASNTTTNTPLPPDERRVEYIVPAHVGHEMPSGLLPLADLVAPLDYCVHNLIVHEDISVLASACLLIAAKLEQPHVTVRALTTVFMRLSLRRCGIPVPEEMLLGGSAPNGGVPVRTMQTPDSKYDDFKLNIIKAEDLVLHLLGFQTFVDSPYKYCQVFLSLLVEDADTPSPAYAHCLQRAVSWLNDAPRSPELAMSPVPSLAAFAIHHALSTVVSLPPNWFLAVGVAQESFAHVQRTYETCLGEWTVSATEAVAAIRAAMPKPQYITLAEWEAHAAKVPPSCQLSRAHSVEPPAVPQEPLGTPPPPPPSDVVPVTAPSAVSSGLEELEKREFLDIREIQRRRRQEEKERDAKRHAKRSRSPSARRGGADAKHSREDNSDGRRDDPHNTRTRRHN